MQNIKPGDPCWTVGVGYVTAKGWPGPNGPMDVPLPAPAVIEGRIIEVDLETGRVLVMPSNPKAWRAPWNKERAEIYLSREDAEEALRQQCRRNLEMLEAAFGRTYDLEDV